MGRKMLKRFVLSALAVCMSLTQINVIKVNAAGVVTDVDVMAQHTEWSSDEYWVLGDGYIESNTVFNYEAPSEEPNTSEWVTVDSDNQTVTVHSYTDAFDNVWMPSEVYLSEEGYDDVYVEINEGVGSFAALREGRTGNNYVVRVTYVLSATIPVETQNKIINAPHYLNKGVAALEELNSYSGSLENLATTYLDALKMLIDGIDVPGLGTIKLDENDTTTRAAINALYNEVNNNSPKRLILTGYINEYVAADAKQVYLVNNAQKVHAQLVDTQTKLNIIAESAKLSEFITTAETIANLKGDEEIINNVNNLKLLRTLIIELNNNLKSAVQEDKWGILNYDYSNALTETGKSKDFSDKLVAGLSTREYEMTQENVNVAYDEVTASVNLYKVVASIEADVIEFGDATNTLKTLDGVSKELFIKADSNLDIIIDTVENSELVESELFKSWVEKYGVNLDNYDISYIVNGNEVDEYELTGPTTIVFKFTPKKAYTITSESAPELAGTGLPYGYNIQLPEHAQSSKSYNYTVNGESMLEGDIYRVVENTTIERVEGKENKQQGLFTVLSNDTSYPFGSGIALTILTSSAVYDSNVQFPVLEQKDADELGLITFDGTEITAKSYPTQISGMEWVAKSYTVGGNTVNFTTYEGNVAKATLGTEADTVTVNYELKIIKANAADTTANFNNKLLAAINLPSELIDSTRTQISSLDRLANNISYLSMGSDIYDGLTLFNSRIEDSNRDQAEKDKLISYANQLKKLCYTGKNLTIAAYVQSYIDEGLISFYNVGTYEVFEQQLSYLATYLPEIATTSEFEKLLTETAGLPVEKLEGLNETVQEIVDLSATFESLRPRDDLININDGGASVLLNAVVKAIKDGTADVPSYVNTDLGLTARASLTKASPLKSIVTVEAKFGTQTSGSVVAGTYEKGHVLTAQDVKDIEKVLKDEAAELNADAVHYAFNYTLPEVGTELTSDASYTGEWSAHTYTVKVPGAEDTTITYETASFKLPAPVAGTRYIYNIGGKEITVLNGSELTYTIDVEKEFDKLFTAPNAVLNVTRVEENISESTIIEFVEGLNSGLGTSGTQFTLAKNAEGKYAIVFNVNYNEGKQVLGNIQNFVLALRAVYPYIALGDSNNAFSSDTVSIQALINAFSYESGKFGTDNLLNGDINKELKGYNEVVVGSTTGLGSSVLNSTIYLGNSVDAIEQTIPFYITANLPASVEEYLTKAEPYVNINTEGDRFNLVVENTPNRPYQVLLAVMLLTGYAEISDITDVDFQGAVDYITSQSKEILLDENTTSETLQNTIDKLGLEYNLDQYAATIDKVLVNFRKVYNNLDITTEARYNSSNEFVGYNYTISADIAPLLQSAGVSSELFGMLTEYKNGTVNLTVNAGYEINGIGQSYEAAIFDNSKSGVDKVWFTKDLSKEKLGENAVVIITSEITDVIEFANSAIVDLNGQTVDEIRGNGGTVKVFDSAFTDGLVKAVRGNVKVTGGNYYTISEDQIAVGYELNGETVESIFYSFTENEAGEIVLKLKPSFVNSVGVVNKEAVKYLAVDLAIHGGMNFYTASSMTIDGDTIYAINKYEDLVNTIQGLNTQADLINEALGFIDCEGVTAFANKLIEKLADFGAISGKALGTYEIKTTAWNLDPARADENYLTAGLVDGKEFTKTLVVELADDSMADLFAELAKVVKVPTGEGATFVELTSLSYDGELKAVFDGGVKVEVDFTNNVEYTKLMGLILAYNNAEFVEPLVEYLETGKMDAFIEAFNAFTIADVIAAVKEVGGATYAELVSAIDVSETELAGVEDLYNVFDKYIEVSAKALNKLDITGPDRTLGSFDTDGDFEYVADKENWHGLDGYVSFKPFAYNYKDMIASVEVTVGEVVVGYNIIDNSEVDKTITVELDTRDEGITKNMIGPGKVIDIKAKFGTIIDMDFTGSTYINDNGDTGRLYNGATFSVVAEDYAGNKETITILVKILGDVNADGLVKSIDDLAMARHYFGQATITDELALWAADVNGNGSVESNDGLMCAYKYLLGINNAKYKSHLKD